MRWNRRSQLCFQLYDAYKDYGTIPITVPPTLFMFGFFLVGTFGNLNIVIVPLTTKSMRGTCNYLLAFSSLADSIHMSAHCYLAYMVLSGRNFTTLSTCYYVQMLPTAALIFVHFLVLFIGVDRLLSVATPAV